MKKICFLTDSIFTIGGVQRVTAVIAKHLSRTYDVTIVTFDCPSDEDLSIYQLHKANIRYRFISYPRVGKWKNYLCKAYSALYRKLLPHMPFTSRLYAHSSFPSELRRVLTDELREGQYDTIIGVHAPLAVRLAAVRHQLPGIKAIGWIHNSVEALFGERSLYVGSELLEYYIYQFKRLDKVIVLCQDDAGKYLHRYQLPTTVIYNPLTLQPGEQAQPCSKRFLAVGRFSYRHKGFDILIDAFCRFAQHDNEWQLDIVGEGPEETTLRKMISDYGQDGRITLHPFTNHIQDYYSKAGIYVLSSRWEGFGLVLVEAMAHGLPVISSDLPTSKEIMGDFGIYFKNGDSEDLAAKLLEATHTDWKQKSEEAIKIARRFNIDEIITNWKEIL